MQLKEIRERINRIDFDMKASFEERLLESRHVAETKIANGDKVYKPLREKEMEQMYSSPKDVWYLMQLKKTVEISRKYQYSVFIDKQLEDSSFLKNMSAENRKALSEGGTLQLSFRTDRDRRRGLDMQGVLSVLSGSNLRVLHVRADDETGKLQVTLKVDNTEESRKEAYLLAYMLYEETVRE